MKNIRNAFLYSSFFFLSSCGYLSNTDGGVVLDSFKSKGQGKVSFESVRTNIFVPHCVSCHSQYSTYSGIKRDISLIEDAVFQNRMPKSAPPLSNELKEILVKWIALGSPNSNDNEDDIEKLEPKWSSLSKNLFVPRCVICHSPNGQAKFLDLSTKESVYGMRDQIFGSGRKFINSEVPSESYLIEIVTDDVEPMPPTWSKIPRLTDDEVSKLLKWIELELPD